MAKDTRVSGSEFYLDTASFDEADNLMFSWAGAGRDMFEKKYRVLSQQFGDLSDDLRDISESIYQMEQEYIQADTDLAKALDGSDNRY